MKDNEKMAGWDPVGRDGELVLHADADREMGALYNEVTGQWSDPQPLQVFFKWGTFVEVEG